MTSTSLIFDMTMILMRFHICCRVQCVYRWSQLIGTMGVSRRTATLSFTVADQAKPRVPVWLSS